MDRRTFVGSLAAGVSLLILPFKRKEIIHEERRIEVRTVGRFSGATNQGRDKWVEVPSIKDLRTGDVFRMWEEDGTLVDAGTELELCVVTKNPFLVDHDPHKLAWAVRCDSWT